MPRQNRNPPLKNYIGAVSLCSSIEPHLLTDALEYTHITIGLDDCLYPTCQVRKLPDVAEEEQRGSFVYRPTFQLDGLYNFVLLSRGAMLMGADSGDFYDQKRESYHELRLWRGFTDHPFKRVGVLDYRGVKVETNALGYLSVEKMQYKLDFVKILAHYQDKEQVVDFMVYTIQGLLQNKGYTQYNPDDESFYSPSITEAPKTSLVSAAAYTILEDNKEQSRWSIVSDKELPPLPQSSANTTVRVAHISTPNNVNLTTPPPNSILGFLSKQNPSPSNSILGGLSAHNPSPSNSILGDQNLSPSDKHMVLTDQEVSELIQDTANFIGHLKGASSLRLAFKRTDRKGALLSKAEETFTLIHKNLSPKGPLSLLHVDELETSIKDIVEAIIQVAFLVRDEKKAAKKGTVRKTSTAKALFSLRTRYKFENIPGCDFLDQMREYKSQPNSNKDQYYLQARDMMLYPNQKILYRDDIKAFYYGYAESMLNNFRKTHLPRSYDD